MRLAPAALAASLLVASPALAQVTYAPEVYTVVDPATVVVPRTRFVVRSVLVARSRAVRRVVTIQRTRLVRRRLAVPVYGSAPAGFAVVYPGTGILGPTWVPPGTSYSCLLGTIGCDSSVVGPLAF